MTCTLSKLTFDAHEPSLLAHFWSTLLDRRRVGDRGHELCASDSFGFSISFVHTPAPKRGPNQMHFDLTSSSLEDQQRLVALALDLGGSHLDVGQRGDEGHVVLADPEGNEFCVIEPDNRFLAGCGAIGALSSDGSQEVGYFWSHALQWPLVWDQDAETAIQAPSGGTKITWGGPPVATKTGRNRLRLGLGVIDQPTLLSETSRLTDLGALVMDTPGGDEQQMLDPDGNEFTLAVSDLG
ncbi:VOC family protein [Rudaeicoccus suwonensis]|uniref:Glyoxalase-like domain-containing protein n=1 Tax=Rudaeicoccus suwonensis TaxID=657409 RepID=A0A561E3L4_9MICO|nr:VOC family protein [Rudaeicoccus suwonensis]TWE10198.1 hypothetical protein BKA23_2551 [Rudaeicoccus suwonensis]